jgi:hypothetical protein
MPTTTNDDDDDVERTAHHNDEGSLHKEEEGDEDGATGRETRNKYSGKGSVAEIGAGLNSKANDRLRSVRLFALREVFVCPTT